MIKAKTFNIQKARLEQGYNQSEVSKKIGLNTASYSLIESGRVSPRPKTAKKFCDFFQRPFGELFEVIDASRVG
jgi:DNA-binding XRE family transcriptional regulator